MKLSRFVSICCAVALSAVGVVGCSDKDKKSPEIKTKDGIATKIDLVNNIVSMEIKGEDGKPRTLDGSVREDTEVVIDGRAHTLRDIREGDHVTVSGYKDGKGEAAKLIATKVVVKRASDSDWKNTGAGNTPSPTSKPAAPATPATAPKTTTAPASARASPSRTIRMSSR